MRKIVVRVEKITEYQIELEVQDEKDCREQCKALTDDDLRENGSFVSVKLLEDQNGKLADVTSEIQPYTPGIHPN